MKQVFTTLASRYSPDLELIERLWHEISTAYNSAGRHYHNLEHLEYICIQLQPVLHRADDADTLLFAVFYHDFIYDTRKQDNEAQSAFEASRAMKSLKMAEARIEKSVRHILATKNHEPDGDPDTDLMTDADLSILGDEPSRYAAYTIKIRREYAYVPDHFFRSGRKMVLQRLLDRPRIFRTDHFHALLEQQARKNLQREISTLGG